MLMRKEVIFVKKIFSAVTLLVALTLMTTVVFAGNVERGKYLFSDPTLGTTGESCSTCHPNGTKLKDAIHKDDVTLAKITNGCIVNLMKGSPLDVTSADFEDLASYLRSVSTDTTPIKKRKVIVGC